MKPYYTKQILIRQLGIDPYSSKYITDLLIHQEVKNWKTIFSTKVLGELISNPKIKYIHI